MPAAERMRNGLVWSRPPAAAMQDRRRCAERRPRRMFREVVRDRPASSAISIAGHVRQRQNRRFRKCERRDRRRAAGAPWARMNTPRTAFWSMPQPLPQSLRQQPVRLGHERRNENRDDTSTVRRSDRRHRALVVLRRRGSQHVDRIATWPPAEETTAARERVRRSSRKLQAVRLACVGGQNPRPAGVRQDRDPRDLRGSGCCDRSVATSNSSSSACVRMMPACLNSASRRRRRSRAPRWVSAARDPAVERPAFTATIGFVPPTRRAISAERLGLPKLSRYSGMTDVWRIRPSS